MSKICWSYAVVIEKKSWSGKKHNCQELTLNHIKLKRWVRGQTWLLGFYSTDGVYGIVINKDQE